MEHVQTQREIQETLAAAGIRPQRRFGQNFLVDGNLMRRLVQSAELQPDDCVLEVGPGTGGLTDLLVTRVAKVIAVEVDRAFYAILSDRFRDAPQLTLLLGDVLDGKHHLSPAVVQELGEGGTRGIKLVANLPYQAATPLLMNLLVDFPRVRRFCFTVQAEVGERITAQPGGKEFGPLGILCQSLGEISTIARLRPKCFWPVPHVDSVMLRLDVRDRPLIPRDELRGFAAFVRAVFEHRRKQLRAALSYALPEAPRTDFPRAFDLTRRPEQLTIQEWLELYRTLNG